MEEREMKKIHLFIVTLITCSLITLFVACEKDEEIDLTTISVSNEQCTPSYTSATLQCSFATKATLRNVYVQYATTQDFVEYDEMEMSKSDDVYSVVLDSLQDNTTYYVRYAVSNRYSSAITEEISTFQTLQPSVPTIALKSISDIWDTHAKAEIALEFDGGSQISEMGICWNTQPAPVVENNKRTTKDTIAALEIKDLQPNTRYFVRSYAMNKVGVAYSEEYEFTTFSLPEIKTEEMTDVQLTTAMLHGTLVFNGNDTAAIKGFCWSTNEDPTVENNHIEIDTASAMYTYRLSNLIDETQYHVRAYAQNKIGIVYGEQKIFTTQLAMLPTVASCQVSNIDHQSAIIIGNVISDGGADVSECGIVYSTSQNPTTWDNKVTVVVNSGAFVCEINNLQANTMYHVRGYAVNRKGLSYGENVTFTTLDKPQIGVENNHQWVDLGLSVRWAAMNIGATIPEDKGNYFAWGEIDAKEKYYWGNYKWCMNSEHALTKYNPEPNYGCYGFSDDKAVLELPDDAASVIWGGAWRIATYEEWNELIEQCTWKETYQNGVNGYLVTSNLNGNSIFLPVTGLYYDAQGNQFYRNEGHYWSKSLPTIYPYPYDANSICFGTDYIGARSRDRCCGLPIRPILDEYVDSIAMQTVITNDVTEITETTAVVSGYVTCRNDMEVIERGFCVNTVPYSDISNVKFIIEGNTGQFTYVLNDLQKGNTYYVRAYATNNKGTTYGEEVAFTTRNGVENGYVYVDLGLSVKWATMNIGAYKPEEYGDYFAWAETEPKEIYNESTYKWCNGKYTWNNLTGYTTPNESLYIVGDAAYVAWGYPWRIATPDEWKELLEKCIWTKNTRNGVDGYDVTSKSNGNSIFLPTAGYRYDNSLVRASHDGYYWTNKLPNEYLNAIFVFVGMSQWNGIDLSSVQCLSEKPRYYGYSIRPVCP